MDNKSNPLDKFLSDDQVIASERFEFHLGHQEVSYDDYAKNQRQAIQDCIKSKRIIHLDTNAWKCLSDYEREKTALTDAMVDFAHTMNSEQVRNKCIFPIGIATLFELQSMEDPISLSTLANLVDRFSAGAACQPPDEVIAQELALFNQKATREAGSEPDRFCHPVEIMGKLRITVPNFLPTSGALAFAKTLLDISHSLPTSAHLEMAAASLHPHWNNVDGIDEMNEGMNTHKAELKTYADALLVELTGVLTPYVPDGLPVDGWPPRKAQAGMAMIHWAKNPDSRHLFTARIQANLHAVVRHLETRKFQKGDIADIITASIALPSSQAFFTDKRLANLLNEPRVGLRQYCSCDVVSGFDKFAAYLRESS